MSTITFKTFLLLLHLTFYSSEIICPERCDNIIAGYAPCPSGYAFVPNAVCGCFGDCVAKKGYGGECTKNDECAPGLLCQKDKKSKKTSCDLDKKDCRHYEHITPENHFIHDLLWKPRCESDGSYAPVQCKGEKLTGRCFCYDKTGQRIFGEEWWTQAEDMTCACSRKVNELKIAGIEDTTLHCSADGNYEELQCDSSFCWCVEPKTGVVNSMVVLEHYANTLSCYGSAKLGSQYLRKCESERIASLRVLKHLQIHGTENFMVNMSRCDPDGSYGRYQFNNEKMICTWIDNTPISQFESQHGISSAPDCNCARDLMIYTNTTKFESKCGATGNYNELQYINDELYCIDSDGFPISSVQTTDSMSCKTWIYEKSK